MTAIDDLVRSVVREELHLMDLEGIVRRIVSETTGLLDLEAIVRRTLTQAVSELRIVGLPVVARPVARPVQRYSRRAGPLQRVYESLRPGEENTLTTRQLADLVGVRAGRMKIALQKGTFSSNYRPEGLEITGCKDDTGQAAWAVRRTT